MAEPSKERLERVSCRAVLMYNIFDMYTTAEAG